MKAVIAAAFLLTPEAPAQAPALDAAAGTTARHDACIALIAGDVETGRSAARQWATEGGGAPALHCLAVAELAAGYPKLAAVRLSEIAERSDAGDGRARARLYAEAALAFLDANDPSQAEVAVAAAKKIAPVLPELDFVAAKVYAAGEKWPEAESAVDALEKAEMASSEAYLIRARSRRALGRDAEAAEDVAEALNLDPQNLDALVLRGELAQAGVAIDAYYGDERDE